MAAAIVGSLRFPPETALASAAARLHPRGDATADVRGDRLPEPPLQAAALAVVADVEPDRAPEVATPDTGAPPRSDAAVVHGRLLDQDGIAVPSAVVSLYRGATRLDASTDAAGAFEFPGLAPGLYRAVVQADALPQGLLPPGQQHLAREPEQNPDGQFATAFRLENGAEQTLVLRAFAAGSVNGRVVDEVGAPLCGAVVGVRSPSGITGDARTDASGRFKISMLPPARYTTSVRLDPARPDADAAAPLPAVFELGPHEDRALPDLVAEPSGHVLRGAVVDLTGQAVAGLTIECREERVGEDDVGGQWSRVTDAAGRYELGRVPSGVLLLTVADAERQAGRLREPVEPLRVDARGDATLIDVPAIRVDAGRPFRVVGRVRVDADWAPASGFGRWKARVLLRALDAPVGAEEELRVGPTGDFAWSCATPHADVELVVVLRGAGGRELERRERLQPVADESRELVVAFPD